MMYPPAQPAAAQLPRPGFLPVHPPRDERLSRATLAHHGGMTSTVANALGQVRPATSHAVGRAGPAAAADHATFRPLSLRPSPAAPAGRPSAWAPASAAASVQGAAPADVAQARRAWLAAASDFPLTCAPLRPVAATGNLNEGDANVVRDTLRLLGAPALGQRWLVTEYDERTESSSKRRRWAIDARGTFACALEFLPPHERGAGDEGLVLRRRVTARQQAAQARALAQFEASVVQEVQTAALLNRDLTVHALLRTADARLVAIMTDFPEEVSYLSQKLPGPQRKIMAYRLFAEVALRLHQDLHCKGLVHGDLKPANVMMTAAGDYTLIDFEHTRPVGADGLVAAADCREPTFAPPEYRRTGQMGKAGDMWALGASLVHIFAFGDVTERMTQMQPGGRAWRQTEQQFTTAWDQYTHALAVGDLEQVRPALATAHDPLQQLTALQRTRPYLATLVPFAAATPEIFRFTMGSLLAASPSARPDAAEARALGARLVHQYRAQVADNRTAERNVLITSASLEVVAPTLAEIARDEGFLRP